MTRSEFIEKRNAFIQLAKIKATGTPNKLADKFNMPRRTLFRFIKQLREEGFDIKYCRKIRSYCLT